MTATEDAPAVGFTLAYDSFEPKEEGLREALASTGNGYFCTRGTAEWQDADGTHYPGTYAHGLYNRETTILGGRPVLNEDLVNLPNSGKYLPSTVNDTTLHFFDWITKSGLDIQRVAAVHGPTTTLQDLRAAVEKKRAGR